MEWFEPIFHTPPPFATPVDVDQVMASASKIGEELKATVYGPDPAGGGQVVSIWPPLSEPGFVSLSARPLPTDGAWVRAAGQGAGTGIFSATDQISTTLSTRIGTLASTVSPPARQPMYDRDVTRKLEGEIHELLQALAADPSSAAFLSSRIYQLELKLQDITDLGC